METEENAAIVQRLYDNLFNRRHLGVADEVIAPTCLHHTAPPGTPNGPEGMRRVLALWQAAYPGRRFIIDDVIADGDTVAVRLTVSWATTAWPDARAPGERRLTHAEVHVLRLANGQVTEYWAVPDPLRPGWCRVGGTIMFMVRIEHPVPDFAGWKAAFDSDPVGRKRSGVRRYQILRALDNPNDVMIDLEFDTKSEAEALLAAMRAVWGRVEGSIMSHPQARIVEVVESMEYGRPQPDEAPDAGQVEVRRVPLARPVRTSVQPDTLNEQRGGSSMIVSAQSHDPKEQQRAIWAQSATPWRRWRREMAHQGAAVTELMVQLARVQPGQRVLDLASGAGEPALSLAAAVAPDGEVMASDLVPAMLDAITEEAQARGLTTLRVQPADMEALPFPDRTFDVATCRFGIMFAPDVARALQEIRRVLRPGGRAAFVVWGRPDQPFFTTSLGIFLRYTQQPAPPPEAPSPFRFAQPGALAEAVRAAGFRDVTEEAQTLRWAWPGTPEEAWAAMGEVQGAFFRQVRAALDEQTDARATAEALAALRQHYDGVEVNTPAEIIAITAVA